MSIEKLKCRLQYLLPQHGLSRLVAKLADCKIPLLKNTLIKLFIYCYKIDINIAASSALSDYASFNEFFTRGLKQTTRPIATDEEAIVSPADGTVSQVGAINEDKLYQAKGHHFSLKELLGGDVAKAQKYEAGKFITLYLAPHDYHRVHMPIDGKLLQTIYVPGQLFSVNSRSVSDVPNLFCRNERLICLFDTKIGEIALIMVGAMLVASIHTVWGQRETPCRSQKIIIKNYEDENIYLNKGSEMGHFQFGSTVILLFRPHTIALNDINPNQQIKMGEVVGYLVHEGK